MRLQITVEGLSETGRFRSTSDRVQHGWSSTDVNIVKWHYNQGAHYYGLL